MNSMDQRLKQGLGLGSKRKSSANNPSVPQVATTPGQVPGVLPGQPVPLSTSSSASSLNAIMNHPGAGQRPPSYTAGYPQGTMGNRTISPPMPPGPGNTRTPLSQVMGGPPPINTAAQHTTAAGGYPPQYGPPGPVGPPLQGGGGPPVGATYSPRGTLGAPVPYAARNNAVEVEGAGRSKSQLIVGIDFVSACVPP
jgi:hypothetical protein